LDGGLWRTGVQKQPTLLGITSEVFALFNNEMWVKFLKDIVNLASHGYKYYCRADIPEEKAHKVESVFKKLSERYQCGLSKDQKYRRKKKGLANYEIKRWERHIIVMRTEGKELDPCGDIWFSLEKKPYDLSVGPHLRLYVGKAPTGRKFTVYLARNTYRWLREILREDIIYDRDSEFKKHLSWISDLPAFSGICHQMKELRKYLNNFARSNRYRLKVPVLRLKNINRQ